MNYAVIFAGGSGQRMKTEGLPKQFLKLEGVEIIIHTISVFERNSNIDAISVVCIDGWLEHLQTLVKKFSLSKVKWIVPGGATGQESIYNGLSVLPLDNEKDIVLIHDGVRPFINNELITTCINGVKEYGSAISVTSAIETIVNLDKNGFVNNIMNRNTCYHAKAPQGFYLLDIINNHYKAQKEGKNDFIDSASLMLFYGTQLNTVECGSENIKITTPADYFIAKALFAEQENKQAFGV